MKPFIKGPKPLVGDAIYYNGAYQVIVRARGDMTELAIRREDRQAIMDWRDVQWIKNQILGPEIEAVQLFPAESRLIDTSNQYYIYALPAGVRFPFGFLERGVSESISLQLPGGHGKSEQRPFAEHVRPADLEESERRMRRMIKEIGLEGQ